MKILSVIIFSLFFLSCKTVKEVVKTKTVYDSTAIEQNEALQHTLQETIVNYEKEREQWLKTGILFDTVYRDTGSLKVIPKIIFDNGKIKSVEGRLLAINQNLHESNSEIINSKEKIDSLNVIIKNKDLQLSKKQETESVYKKRTSTPYWLFAICFAVGIIFEWRFKILKRILSLKTIK